MNIYNSNINIKIFFFISSILLFLPIAESYSVDGVLNDGDLEMYIFLIFGSLILTLIILYKFKYFNNINIIYFDKVYSQKFLIFISFISFMWFLFFVTKNINSFSILDVVAFAEGYRNGAYTGSGIYTAPILLVLPSFLLLIIMKQSKLNFSFYLAVLLVFIASSLVGLRIYLFGIIIFGLHRVFIKSNPIKLIFSLVILFLFLVSFKYFLNDTVKDMSFFNIIIYILSRLDYRTLLEFNGFEIGFEQLKYLFDFPTITHFKEIFFSFNNDIAYGMPFVYLYSGIALVLPVFLYNTIYIFMPVFVAVYILFSMYILKKILISKSLILSSFLVNLYFIQILVLIEDLGGITKIPLLMIVSIFMIIGIKVSNIKIIFKRNNYYAKKQ
jgi:hypothetical protein